jgi:phosphoglycerate kinase
MAFTFLKALEYDVGKSIVEEEMVEEVKKLLADNNKKLIIANDENCATTFANEPCQYRTAEEGFNNLMALDIGKRTIADFGKIIENAKTIF